MNDSLRELVYVSKEISKALEKGITVKTDNGKEFYVHFKIEIVITEPKGWLQKLLDWIFHR